MVGIRIPADTAVLLRKIENETIQDLRDRLAGGGNYEHHKTMRHKMVFINIKLICYEHLRA